MRAGNRQDVALLQLGRALKEIGYRFTSVTPATHARVNGRTGCDWARCAEDVFGWSRPFHAHILPPALLELMGAADVLASHQDGLRSTVRFSSLGNDLFAHSAYPTDGADSVFFGPDTYRFVAALDRWLSARDRPIRRAADIGCGAGPGAILVASRHPDAEVLALDINDEALRLASVNAALAGVKNVVCARSDLLSGVEGRFDLIVSNPPYLVDPDTRTYRHGGGGHGEGLSLAIAEQAGERLNPDGSLVLYTGSAIVDGVDRFRHTLGTRLEGRAVEWSYEELDPDIFGEELMQSAYADTQRIAAVLVTMTRTVR